MSTPRTDLVDACRERLKALLPADLTGVITIPMCCLILHCESQGEIKSAWIGPQFRWQGVVFHTINLPTPGFIVRLKNENL